MKNILRIQEKVYNHPLLITKSSFNAIHSVIQRKVAGLPPMINADLEDVLDDEPNMYSMKIEGNVATIPIQGILGKKLSLLEVMCGCTDVDLLREEIQLADTNPDVEMIIYDVDSGGGSVEGIPDLAQYISDVNKRKHSIAVVDGMCCSGAYYLMAGVSEIFACGKTSYIGSIGCYSFLLDESRMYANDGVEAILIKSPTDSHKGDGLPGLKITDEMKQKIQSDVNYINDLFVSHLKSCRPQIKEEDLNGEAWYAVEACKKGFVDEVISNKNELLSFR